MMKYYEQYDDYGYERDDEGYCQSIGMKFFAKKWQDKTVIVSI